MGAGNGIDLCICVHAEASAVATAARFGVPVNGWNDLHHTHQPHLSCGKELLQAGITKVWYAEPIEPPEERVRADYERLQEGLSAQQL
ncbi:MAG: hypothetical protein ACRDWD_06655 [Acidimicrobiia bacterium]